MTWWRRKTAVDDLESEFEAHLELAEHELRARGVAPDEARRLARLQFGNQRVLREDARAEAGWARLDAFALDTRHALRRLTSDPSTSWLAMLLLAAAIGLAAAMFTVADALLLRPAPFPDPDTLVRVRVGEDPTDLSPNLGLAAYKAMRGTPGARIHVGTQHSALFDDGTMEDRRPGALVTPGLLEELGVRPIRGRTFSEDDARDGHAGAHLRVDVARPFRIRSRHPRAEADRLR